LTGSFGFSLSKDEDVAAAAAITLLSIARPDWSLLAFAD
jgi:hypothetical protein